MFRAICAIGAVFILVTSPVVARDQLPVPRPTTKLVGLPILSSDGEKIGQITGVESEGDHKVLIGEIDRPMGLGSDEVAVPVGVYVERGDHIELTVTAVEVRDAIARARR